MTPAKRSTLQLDLKDLSAKQSTAGVHHFVLASFTTIALISVYILINSPSASTNNLDISSQVATRQSPSKIANTPSTTIPESNTLRLEENIIDESILGQTEKKPTSNPLEVAKLFESPDQELEDTSFDFLEIASLSNNKEQYENLDVNTPTTDPVLDLITPAEKVTVQEISHLDALPWIISDVRKGDTLSEIFNRNGIKSRVAYNITQLNQAKSLLRIRPGQKIKLKKNSQGEFALLQYKLDQFETLTIKSNDNDYFVEVTAQEAEIRFNNAKATIYSSLLNAANKTGVSSNTIYNFIALFGWQVDFTMDIRVGDKFSLIYEELYLEDEKVGDGNIIAAELIVSDKKYQAIRFEDEDGFTHYYAPNGDGIKGTFLRTPLKFGHVTSNYSNNRLHPIKNVWTAHTGVDYGAPRGTPILATGDGVVRHAGRKNGYGKTVILRHGGKYDTLYAHMNGYAKNIRTGAKVKQGDIIGYVGSTGLATGSHLHYEFRIHGIHKNPMTVELPKSAPIPEIYKSIFQQSSHIWVTELEFLNRIPLAQNEINP